MKTWSVGACVQIADGAPTATESIATLRKTMLDENEAQRGEIAGIVRSSKTIQRPKNQCRVVITLEVEVAHDMMKALPSYMTDATDFLRAALAQQRTAIGAVVLLDELRHDGDLRILSTKVESDK